MQRVTAAAVAAAAAELCKGIADGLYPVPGQCLRYTECTAGSMRNLRCPPRTYFSHLRSACTLIDETGAMDECAVQAPS